MPDNKVRIVCSGDSFTMGFGVDNDHAWCKLLESVDGRIESVNLAQGGYGVDQSYLWYQRNKAKLEHDIHVFAFITEDFTRMENPKFGERGKPFFVLDNDVLVNKNKPVSKPSFTSRFAKIREAVGDLRSVVMLNEIVFRKRPLPTPTLESDVQKMKQTQDVAARIIHDLQESSKATNSTLVLVYLPIRDDFIRMDSEPWRRFLRDEALKHNLLFIDLIDEFRQSSLQEVKTLFDDKHNHYSETGNLYIATRLYQKLLAIPEIESKFGKK